MPSKQWEEVSGRMSNIYFAINWVILKNIDNGRKTERGEKNEFAIITAGRW